MNTETDPNGKDQHEAGSKLDSGKVRPALVFKGFANALWEVSKVGTLGSIKYTEYGFLEVKDGEARYADAQMRHFLKDAMSEEHDSDLSDLAKANNLDGDNEILHLACEAWNSLAKLEFRLKEKKLNNCERITYKQNNYRELLGDLRNIKTIILEDGEYEIISCKYNRFNGESLIHIGGLVK